MQPEWEPVSKSATVGTKHTGNKRVKIEGGAEVKASEWVKWFADFGATLKAVGELGTEEQKSKSGAAEAVAVDLPERRLVLFVARYLDVFPGRILSLTTGTAQILNWSDFADLSPRPLVFLDVTAGTPIVPTAVESTDGKPLLIYDLVEKKLWPKERGITPPTYPKEGDPNRAVRKAEYWKGFFGETGFNTQAMMTSIEEASTNIGRFDWINFRLKYGNDTIHLNCNPRGAYSAGTFAYNFVRRGFNYGTRIVGTLREGPAINVLAIYEK
jgi:hypothetical protein